ncbi:crotonase/enoyl-CoA hydratase family protein [Yinghuangia sp. ASG 101]|uniref:crotonase/enoyl-CoA hydratase family protein n=1 Tax=Yinghuangia sp. ASG 101 TaxID=2896848 RepID=UPI001E643820|nr:crotonase/enoyl-CoA hydratase family protein [Yinghuangia sp. ASG 101]UGQ11224.1 crotonase/enoyl-CoA hydratase family protein [Yinghuangia sp. ASG 101]
MAEQDFDKRHETVLTDLTDRVLTVTLNRPDRLNAFNPQVMADLLDVLDRADADDEVRVVIVTGAGRGFCAGADVSAGGGSFDHRKAGAWHRDTGGRVALRLYACAKPVIAAINGAAVGVGASMTLPMDIRLASTTAKFGFVFARRGIVPESAAGWFLPRAVGMQRAMEWVATGRVFGADEALAAGLVRSVHEPDELLPAAREIAREIVENTAPVSVALSRQMMWRMLGEPHPMTAHRLDSRIMSQIGGGPDPTEGIESFLAKRPPKFPGRVSTDMPEIYPWWREEEFRPLDEDLPDPR